MFNVGTFQTYLFWLQVVLAVWQVIKLTPIGVVIRALLWSATHWKPPLVRKNLLVVGVSNSVYALTNRKDHSSYEKGNFSISYEYPGLGHLAHLKIGSEVRTYHFEEPELYDNLLTHFSHDAAIYMDEGIFIFGISKFRPLTVVELCESVLVGRKNCMFVPSRWGIIVDNAEKGSDYFLQSLSLFNIVCKITLVTAFTTLLYIVLDRWHWLYSQLLSINSKIFVSLTRRLLLLLKPATRLKIYLSLDPYCPNLQPCNFVTNVVEVRSGEFVYLPNGRFDGFKQTNTINAQQVSPKGSQGSRGLFKYQIEEELERETHIYRTRIRVYFCDVLTVERVYRWPPIKVRFLKLILEKVCEVEVGPISACRKSVAHVCKVTQLLDFVERKNEWFYIGLITLCNVTLEGVPLN